MIQHHDKTALAAKAVDNKALHFGFRSLFYSQKLLWVIAWLLGIITVLSVLGLVMVAGWFITMAAAAGVILAGGHVLNYFIPSALIRMFAISRTLARYGDLMVSHHAVFGLLKDLRVRFFAQWAKLPPSLRNVQDESSGQKMQRLVKDIDTLDEFMLRIISPWVVALVACAAMVLAIAILVPYGAWVVLPVGLSLVVAWVVLMSGVSVAKQESQLSSARKGLLLDVLPSITQLLTWNQWQQKANDVATLDKSYQIATQKAHQLRRRSGLAIQLCVVVAVALVMMLMHSVFTKDVVAITIENINHYNWLNPALGLALVLGLLGLMEVVLVLVVEPLAWGRSLVAKSRVNELIVDSSPIMHKKQMINQPLRLVLDDVSVRQPKAVLGVSGISATIGSDEPVLIMGASGVGKSTLLATLAGEIEPVGGRLMLNGEPYLPNQLSGIGFLGQMVDIFDQTLADNLRLGNMMASDEQLWSVLAKVGLADWAKAQPKGLDTPLGEYGMAVSGGQARRIALARLLLSPKAMLLLDEPFAGLDSQTRQQVWQTLVDMQASGDIGILVIATHQIWGDMHSVNVIELGR